MYHLQVGSHISSHLGAAAIPTFCTKKAYNAQPSRRRRVKCDEGRPNCNRCVKAGRPCEGYASTPGSGRSEPIRFVVYSTHNTIVPSETPDLDWSERRALSFFQDRTALELAGAFATDFWLVNILPLARREQSVRHALIALSSMHEHFSGVDHVAPTRSLDFALSHYGKAMREVVQLSQSHASTTFDRALVTCALFAAFESLQGNYHAACNHAVSGIKILAEEQRNLVRARQVGIPREVLTRFFLSMERQIVEIGDPNFQGPKPELLGLDTTLPERFTSYEHALFHMEIQLRNLSSFAGKIDKLEASDQLGEDVYPSLMAEFQLLQTRFDAWKSAFDIFSSSDEMKETSTETPESTTSSSPGGATSRRTPAFLILKVYDAAMTAFLARIQRSDEAVLNDFVPEFQTALNATEEFIQSTSTLVTPLAPHSTSAPSSRMVVRPTFSLALGIIPVLFLMASRTADPHMRNRALALLAQCNRREGFWDSRLAARVVERIVALRDLGLSSRPADDPDSDTKVTPQFRLVDIKFLPGRRCALRYKFTVPRTVEEEMMIRAQARPPAADETRHHTVGRVQLGAGLLLDREYLEELEWEEDERR